MFIIFVYGYFDTYMKKEVKPLLEEMIFNTKSDFLFVFLRQNATYKENLLFINTYMESLDISKKSLDESLLFIMSRDILDQLLCLFNEFSDEIPKEIIHSDSVNTKYKIRGGRFYAVSLKISRLHTY